MKVIKGSLINLAKQGNFDVVIHGCNCFNTMGAGIAKQLSKAFPEIKAVDARTIRGDWRKLGDFSIALCGLNNDQFFVVNAYTQYHFGSGKINVEYSAIQQVMNKIRNSHFFGPNFRFAYPKIGAGLGGGDWRIISEIIDQELSGLDHTLVEYAPKSLIS